MNKAKLILNTKLFIRKTLIHFVILGSIIVLAWITDKWIESIFFCIAHYSVRKRFTKQYHTVTKYCIPLTITIAFFLYYYNNKQC